MDLKTFQATYPAFRETNALFVEATIARATRMVDATVWGAQQDDGIGLLTAHWLWIDAFGSTTALKGGDGQVRSMYGEQFEAMKLSIIGGGFAAATSFR